MREHYYRTNPARVRNGIPETPSYMLIGTEFITIDDARLVSIQHLKGTGRILFHVVSESGAALLHPKSEKSAAAFRARALKEQGTYRLADEPAPLTVDDAPEGTPEILRFGVRLAMTLHSVQEVAACLRVLEPADEKRFFSVPKWLDGAPEAAETIAPEERAVATIDDNRTAPLDIGETPAFSIHRMRDDSAFVFLRSFNHPYAIRLHLTKEDRALFSDTVTQLLLDMPAEEWDAHIVALDVPCVVGPQPEQRNPLAEPLPEAASARKTAPAALPTAPPPAPGNEPQSRLSRFFGRMFGLG